MTCKVIMKFGQQQPEDSREYARRGEDGAHSVQEQQDRGRPEGALPLAA